MTRLIRTAAVVTVLTLASGLLLETRSALAQGPYGRNGYDDFPFNQGSLFYRPLKPKPKPKVRVVRPPVTAPSTASPTTGYGAVQRYTTAPQPRYYYYYPAYPR